MQVRATALFAVTSMHEEVHERATQQQQIGKNAEQVRPVFREKEEANDRQKYDQHHASAQAEPSTISWIHVGDS
jgi:hypothetical protein